MFNTEILVVNVRLTSSLAMCSVNRYRSPGIQTMHLDTMFLMILIMMHFTQGADYLVAIPFKSLHSGTFQVNVIAGETGGSLHCYSPNHGWRRSLDIRSWGYSGISIPTNIGTINEVEHKAFLCAFSDSQASLSIYTSSSMSFAALPTTALGTKYIVSSCYQSLYSLLVIAAYNVTTSVSIQTRSKIFGPSFNRKNSHKFELKPFQTFTYEYSSDLTWTVVTSSKPVAVYSGTSDYTRVTAYEQLLPVRLYDKEYVVAVNDNPSRYHLQILSEKNNTVVNFNNGKSKKLNNNLYQNLLASQEILYFHSNNPIMVTICRRAGENSGFMVVPPVSLYSLRTVYISNRLIFMTRKETIINSLDIRWTYIPNSDYKTGVLSRGSKKTMALGCNLFLQTTSIRTGGITFAQSGQIDVRKSFLVAMPDWSGNTYANLQLSSSQSASYQVMFPHGNETHTRQIFATSSDNFYIKEEMQVIAGVENKAIRVDVDSENTQLSFVIGQSYSYPLWKFSVFPTSVLGQEYIVQACSVNTASHFQLIVVSSFSNTDISVLLKQGVTYDTVEFKPGDTIRVHLQPYQTLTINSSVALCGTSVSSSHNVAVFTLSRSGSMASYNQLLPVEELGREYIVVANDEPVFSNTDYYVLVTSATGPTEIKFSYDLKVTVGNAISYRKDLGTNESVYFTSTKPVMASLCNDHSHQCTVIVPTKVYTTESMFSVLAQTMFNILTDSENAQVNLTWSSHNGIYKDFAIDITWEIHTGYKIGTVKVYGGQILISSTHRFTTLGFFKNLIPNEVIIWNPIGWTKQTDKCSAIDCNENRATNEVNTTAIAIGTIFGILILILLAVVIYQQIYIRRSTSVPMTKAGGRSGENETSFSQGQPQGMGGVSTVSTVSTTAVYSDLHTEPQALNTYEGINHKTSEEQEVEYETF